MSIFYEESNLSKSFPTKFTHRSFKVLDYKWFGVVGSVLVFDLLQKRLFGFIGSLEDTINEEDQVKEIINRGCTLPTDTCIVMFKEYFYKDEVFVNLDKNFKLFLNLMKILDDKE